MQLLQLHILLQKLIPYHQTANKLEVLCIELILQIIVLLVFLSNFIKGTQGNAYSLHILLGWHRIPSQISNLNFGTHISSHKPFNFYETQDKNLKTKFHPSTSQGEYPNQVGHISKLLYIEKYSQIDWIKSCQY